MRKVDNVLILDRFDLLDGKKSKDIDEISIFDFKINEYNIVKSIKENPCVKFIDIDGKSKILKDRDC